MALERNVRFPDGLWEAIRRIAKQHGRSTNAEIIWALRQYEAEHGGEDSGPTIFEEQPDCSD